MGDDIAALAERAEHIPDAEVKQDISDTEAEIIVLEREVKGLRLIGDKLSVFKADAKEAGIKERQEFIAELQALLAYRAEAADD